MSSMVKQDHMKDLCGSIRAMELVKCASFEFSSQLTEKKQLQAIEKHVPFAKKRFHNSSNFIS